MIFNIFKRNKECEQSIATELTSILKQKPKNLHVMVYIKDQVLFQVLPAKNFLSKGLEHSKPNDFVILHFFNKNKTLTFDKLKTLNLEKNYFFYEEPKENFNYLKVIGQNPNEIEKEIYSIFKEIYELDSLNDINIEYADY